MLEKEKKKLDGCEGTSESMLSRHSHESCRDVLRGKDRPIVLQQITLLSIDLKS